MREGFACDGLYNGIELFLHIFTSCIWISEVHSNGLTTIVDDECREQEMALMLFFFYRGSRDLIMNLQVMWYLRNH